MATLSRDGTPGSWAATLRTAEDHLRNRDERLKAIIDQVGECRLEPTRDPFLGLVSAVIGQQISTKAASSIRSRLFAATGQPPRPEAILETGIEGLRQFGLSRSKAATVSDLAHRVASGQLDLASLEQASDADVSAALTAVKGIGPWTADMVLIFCLGRLDVLPVGDLGMRIAVRNVYGLADVPASPVVHELAVPWRPYASIATWYLWRSLDGPAEMN